MLHRTPVFHRGAAEEDEVGEKEDDGGGGDEASGVLLSSQESGTVLTTRELVELALLEGGKEWALKAVAALADGPAALLAADEEGMTAAHFAARKGNPAAVLTLVELWGSTAPLAVKDIYGITPLGTAFHWGHPAVLCIAVGQTVILQTSPLRLY